MLNERQKNGEIVCQNPLFIQKHINLFRLRMLKYLEVMRVIGKTQMLLCSNSTRPIRRKSTRMLRHRHLKIRQDMCIR